MWDSSSSHFCFLYHQGHHFLQDLWTWNLQVTTQLCPRCSFQWRSSIHVIPMMPLDSILFVLLSLFLLKFTASATKLADQPVLLPSASHGSSPSVTWQTRYSKTVAESCCPHKSMYQSHLSQNRVHAGLGKHCHHASTYCIFPQHQFPSSPSMYQAWALSSGFALLAWEPRCSPFSSCWIPFLFL